MTTAIDLFAGLGGWSTGARAAGVQVLWAANHWPRPGGVLGDRTVVSQGCWDDPLDLALLMTFLANIAAERRVQVDVRRLFDKRRANLHVSPGAVRNGKPRHHLYKGR